MTAPSWMSRAACAGMDVEVFFPPDATAPVEATAVCFGCPVVDLCLAYAVERGEVGVWGGLTTKQRRGMGRPRGVARRSGSSQRDRDLLYGCGTPAAYARHIRAKQTPCEPCREAERARRGRLPSRARRTA